MTQPGGQAPLPLPPTLPQAFQESAARVPGRVALRRPGDAARHDWAGYAAAVQRAAGSLAALGVGRGDRVAFLSRNRPELAFAEVAALHLGAAGVALYPTSPVAAIEHVLADSAPAVLLVESGMAARLQGVRHAVPEVLALDPGEGGLRELAALAAPADFDFEPAGGPWRRRISTAAACPLSVHEHYNGLGVQFQEFFAMTETGVVTAQLPGPADFGTLGRPLSDYELRIAPDGEVLVRSPHAPRGYRNREAESAATFGADGWIHTGDVGELDGEGRLRLIDRKKEMLVPEHGHNVSPSGIESALRDACPAIAQVCVFGDGRPYLAALIVLEASAQVEDDGGRPQRPSPPRSRRSRPRSSPASGSAHTRSCGPLAARRGADRDAEAAAAGDCRAAPRDDRRPLPPAGRQVSGSLGVGRLRQLGWRLLVNLGTGLLEGRGGQRLQHAEGDPDLVWERRASARGRRHQLTR
jgi:long-subunit acyl-CoA synthetase (AMP-forming)